MAKKGMRKGKDMDKKRNRLSTRLNTYTPKNYTGFERHKPGSNTK